VIDYMNRTVKKHIMQRLLLILFLAFNSGSWASAEAASLIMVEQEYCEYCEAWNENVGVIYNKTDEGKRAPLRRVDIHDPMPDDLNFISGVIFTPTFILVDNGKEIGRIRGYASESFFWGLLQKLIEKLPEKEKSSALKIKTTILARGDINARATR